MKTSPLKLAKHRSQPGILGRLGKLETRLANSRSEIKQAQRLRYGVFFEEQSAKAGTLNRKLRRDTDRFDAYCDHLVVVDTSLPKAQWVVGTYRILDDAGARMAGGFYSQTEFDLSPILTQTPSRRHLELGRSCIASEYRNRRTMELMWQGIWALVVERKIDLLFGCVSFQGTDTREHQAALSWLQQNASLGPTDDCVPIRNGFVCKETHKFCDFSGRRAFSNLPPLLKGYLRVGARVSSAASVDLAFNTTDLLVVLQVADISPKYIQHYGIDASRFAA